MNVYAYPIKNIMNQIVPHTELSANNMDSAHAAALFKCIFKNAFQYTAMYNYSDEFIVKRNDKMNECFHKFILFATNQIARYNPNWTRRQLLDEVNDVIIEIMDEFITIIRRFALLYDGDETDDPNITYRPMYQTADTIQSLVAKTNFKRHTKDWLKRRNTRRVRVGIKHLRKSLRRPMAQVMNDPFLSHKISNLAIGKSLSMDEDADIDAQAKQALPHLLTPSPASPSPASPTPASPTPASPSP